MNAPQDDKARKDPKPIDSRRMPDFDDDSDHSQEATKPQESVKGKTGNRLGIIIGIIGLILLIMVIHSAVSDFLQLQAITEADKALTQPPE